MARCLIGVGSNLGDRSERLAAAMLELELVSGIQLLARSQWIETEPIGGPPGQGDFLNGALLLETNLEPYPLLTRMLEIEVRLGRSRPDDRSTTHWGPRTIDLDLLLLQDHVHQSARLQLPHPRMPERRFVLAPAAEIAGWMVHPTRNQTVARMLHTLDCR